MAEGYRWATRPVSLAGPAPSGQVEAGLVVQGLAHRPWHPGAVPRDPAAIFGSRQQVPSGVDASASIGQDLTMGCLVALLALALPRVTLVLLWLFTTRLSEAFDSFLLGLLGFLVLPYTTVLYALAFNVPGGVTGFGWFLVIFGFLVDLGVHRNSGRFGGRP
jgi:hypothetical protein